MEKKEEERKMQHSTHSLGASLVPQLGITRARRLNLVRVLPSAYRVRFKHYMWTFSHTIIEKGLLQNVPGKKLVPFFQLLVT